MSFLIKNFSIALLLLFVPLFVFSQENDYSYLLLEEFGGQKVPTALLNKISVDFQDEPLELALATIEEKSRIKLNYPRNDLPLKKNVTLKMKKVYALEALLTVLKNTGTTLKITKGGILAVMPQNDSEQKKSNSFTGIIMGTVHDSLSGEPLPGANIVIKGTAIGAASDLEGNYRILNVPAGKHILRVTFIGYKAKDIPVTIMPKATVNVDVTLPFDLIKFDKAVVVTAQLEGQAAAINQQIRSNTIVNVVSRDKIQELPDQNAAESLGRLPGIAIQRSAGEGQKVVVRGLSPRFSAITVNGERLPGSTDDRSVDLTMISPDVLAGIEIYKALRPDMDGDAIGGRVNFITKKASAGARATVRMFGGYNQVADEYGNYKGNATYSNRFFYNENGDAKLGLVATGSVQRANRSSDFLSGSYYWTGIINNEQIYETSTIGLTDNIEIRDRYSLNLALDYNLGMNHDIILSSLWGRTDRDVQGLTHEYIVEGSSHMRNYVEQESTLKMWTNSLMGNHLFGKAEVNWRTSYSKVNENIPWLSTIRFEEYSAFVSDIPLNNIKPQLVPTYAKNDDESAWMTWNDIQEQLVNDRNLTALMDIKYPFQIGTNFSGYFKIGGKIRSTKREKDVSQWGGNRWAVAQEVNTQHDDMFIDTKGRQEDIALTNFILEDKKSYDDFLKGEYDFNEILDKDKLHWFATTFDSVYRKTPRAEVDARDYSGSETINAAYIMAEFNWKRLITFMPGIRYERTKTDYSSKILNPTQSTASSSLVQPSFNDTLGNRIYENFLPMIQLRIKPLNWFDIRLATTKSLSRPDFYNLIPYERLDWDTQTLQFGNPYLKESVATNYDLCVSFYSRYGLFTVAPFYKKIENIDYVRSGIRQKGYYAPYLTNLKGWTVITPENLKDESIAKGWEFELQTNLKFLPGPLNGIVIYANYSTIKSETQYPYTIYKTEYLPVYPYVVTTAIDTARNGRMIGQADKIANFTLGYEKGGFSGRISMIYQGNALRSVTQARENDGIDDDFIRWDLVLQQQIYKSIKLIAQVNNITDQEEKAYIRYRKYSTRRENFGRTVDVGIQFEY